MSKDAPDYHQEHLKKQRAFPGRINRRSVLVNSAKFLLPPLLIGGYAYYEKGWFEITRTQIQLPQFPKTKRIKILHLSDLHLSTVISIDHLELAFSEGFQNKPNVCVITGDFVTDQPSEQELKNLETCIRKFASKVPTFACLGNHDGGSWAASRNGFQSPERIKSLLKKARVRVLHNEKVNVYLNGIPASITGLGDMWNNDCQPRKCMTRIDPKKGRRSQFNLLLSHNPDTKTLVKEFDWSVMLSGHTHGGQFRIPFTKYAPFAPVADLSHTEGLSDFQGRPIFITRGVGSHYGIRLNCRPEISLIELTGG